MQSTLTLTLDLDTKIGTLTDVTNYSSLGLNPVTYGVKGLGYIKFNGQIIVAATSYLNPLIDLTTPNKTRQFNLELDVNGEVANGIYTVEYIASAQYTTNATSNTVNDTITIDTPNFNNTLFSSPENIYLSITGIGTFSYGSIISVADDGGGNTEFTVASVSTIAASPRSVVLGFRTESQAFVYSGCEKITQDIGFSYDCDTDPTGSWNVYSNTPTPSGVNVSAATGTIEWPSWTGEPTITVASLPYSNTALATGTYGATITQIVTQEIQASPLLEVGYTLESTYEWKVTCAGSLCEMNACIESLRAAHETELLRNKVSKYQPYIDNVAIYLHEADNYKSCAQFDKYRETLAKVKATLDASGCDCGCCDDNEYKWVAVSPATSTFLNNIMSEIQFRVGSTKPSLTTQATGKGLETGAIWHDTADDNLYKATVTGAVITWTLYYDPTIVSITTATNGLTESPAGTVRLGGNLTATTTIGLQNYDLIFDSTTGEVYAKRDGGANSVAYPFAVVGQSNGTTSGAGSGIVFQTQDGLNPGSTLGTAHSEWTTYSADSSIIFTVKNNNSLFETFEIVGSNKSLTAKGYGLGNLIDNNPEYFLGVDNTGNFVEIDPLNVGANASNGLTKTSGDIKLGGVLNTATTITVNNTNTLTLSGIASVTGTADKLLAVTSAGKIVTTSATNADKIYVAQINQTSTSNPVATQIVNTLGVTPTFLYGNEIGVSVMNISGVNFNKACVTFTPGYIDTKPYGVVITYAINPLDASTIRIYTHNPSGGLQNDLLKNALIKVEFYL